MSVAPRTQRPRGALSLIVLLACLAACHRPVPLQAERPARTGIWTSSGELRTLATEGPGWQALVARAREPIDAPNLANQDDPQNVRVLARALVAVRTGDAEATRSVATALARVRGSEAHASGLAVGRELMAYVLAADLIELPAAERAAFSAWLRTLRERSFEGRTLRTTHEDRPNNWGTHAGASRLAAAAYLGDLAEIERAARVFRSWTGEADSPGRFRFGALDWQADPRHPVGVNPAGALRDGHPIGGVLPDDQRRAGPFRWPAPRENYVYEALQGAVAQAVILERLGYDPWRWGDRALLRAFSWLYEVAEYPAVGDDTWMPYIINAAYGTQFSTVSPSRPGKAVGFSDWTHPAGGPSNSGPEDTR